MLPHDKNVPNMRTWGQSYIAMLDRLQPRHAIETITLRPCLRFRSPSTQRCPAERSGPNKCLMRHPLQQRHATTTARMVVIVILLRLVARDGKIRSGKIGCGRFLFSQFFDVSLMNDNHLHMSDGECEHYTLVMNAEHAKFTVRVYNGSRSPTGGSRGLDKEIFHRSLCP